MTAATKPDGSFSYFIPHPIAARILAFGIFAFNAILLIRDHPARHDNALILYLWVSATFIYAGILVTVAIQPRNLRARLEFTSKSVALIPIPSMREFGEHIVTIPIGPQTSEILICRGSQDTYPWSLSNRGNYPKGFRILVRSTSGRDHELKVETGDRLNARKARTLSEGITAVTGLPVRLVRRESTAGSDVRETPWTPAGRAV